MTSSEADLTIDGGDDVVWRRVRNQDCPLYPHEYDSPGWRPSAPGFHEHRVGAVLDPRPKGFDEVLRKAFFAGFSAARDPITLPDGALPHEEAYREWRRTL